MLKDLRNSYAIESVITQRNHFDKTSRLKHDPTTIPLTGIRASQVWKLVPISMIEDQKDENLKQ